MTALAIITLIIALIAIVVSVTSFILLRLVQDVMERNNKTLFDRTRTLHNLELTTKHRVDTLEDQINKIDEWTKQ